MSISKVHFFQLLNLVFLKVINCNIVHPYIIFILADDLGWNDVGFHGSNQIPTPNIDSLAYSGVILNNYYVTPVCTPSRSALMTGKYPIHTGLQHGVIHGSAPYGLSLNETILPQFLKRNGYVTRAVGKWHLGNFEKEYTPEYRGFDSHYGYWVGKQDYYDHTSMENRGYWGYDMRRGMNISWSDYGSYSTDLFTQESVKIIKEHDARKPLFLYLAHLATHSANPYNPLQAPPETVAKFDYIKDKNRRIFAAMVSKLDDSVGDVVEALFQTNMLNNSIIIFSTDNGGPAAGFNNNAASNWPLKGVKDTLWEGGVRGASFIWTPHLQKSKVLNGMMHITDWLPTILSLANVKTNPGRIDGFNMKRTILGEESSPRQEILLNIDNERKIGALRISNWKFIYGRTWNGTYDKWFGPSGRNGTYDWKSLNSSKTGKALLSIKKPLPSLDKLQSIRKIATISCNGDEFLTNNTTDLENIFLFDVDQDPCERNNLAYEKPDFLNMMKKKLHKYKSTVVPPRNKPADPRSNPKYWGYAWVNWMDFI